jgi:hypothetical protein
MKVLVVLSLQPAANGVTVVTVVVVVVVDEEDESLCEEPSSAPNKCKLSMEHIM